ncbi:MAG: glycosyltransferase family 4 protein [Limisphaerales bacterium]
MKIALIRRQFSATGGAELYLQRLLQALLQGGHEPHLFAESWEGRPDGIQMHPVSVGGDRAQRAPRFADAVAAELKKLSFDVIFSLERTHRQDVYRAGDGVHRVWLQRRQQFAQWWRRPFVCAGSFHRNMMKLEARTFDPANTRHVIVNSEMVRREVLENFQFPADRIHLVRNGIDLERHRHGQRTATRERFGIKPDDTLLLFVGSGWERKGLRFVLRAFNRLKAPRVKLLVVGKGRPPFAVPDGTIFAGPMSDVENAYAAADIFVFLPIYEPSSNVVAEALASDLPVITSSLNGASEIITPRKNGTIITDPRDTDAVAEAVRFWILQRGLAEMPPKHELSLERNVEETLAVLELAARENRR